MCHYSGSSFRAALPRRSPSIHRDFGGGKSGRKIRSVNFCLSDMSNKISPSHSTAPLHLVRVILTLFMGHHPSSLNRYAERACWWVRPKETFVQHRHKPSRRRGPSHHIDLPLYVREKHHKQERRNKSNKFITTLPERSECDKRPPVERRSVVGQPLSKHSLGDYRSIRHGSGWGETQGHN